MQVFATKKIMTQPREPVQQETGQASTSSKSRRVKESAKISSLDVSGKPVVNVSQNHAKHEFNIHRKRLQRIQAHKRTVSQQSQSCCVTPVSFPVSVEDLLNCPVCIERYDDMELRFFPCPCGYRVCAMCVHLIKEKADGKCPHCREVYSVDRARVSNEIDSDLRRVLDQRMMEDKRIHLNAKRHDVKYSKRRPRPALATPVAPLSPPPPPATPPPQIKLVRFSGGLSVWD